MLLLFASFVATDSAQAQFIDSINPNAGPEPLFDVRYSPTGNPIGWYYTANTDYQLDGIFGGFEQVANDDVEVTGILFSIYDERPALGGSILRQTSFDGIPSEGGILGGNFDPLEVASGDRLFIGLSNMNRIGVNLSHWNLVSGQPQLAFGATTSLGSFFRDNGDGFGTEITDEFETTAEGARISGTSPILFFSGTAVPEPSSFLVLSSVGLLAAIRRRK